MNEINFSPFPLVTSEKLILSQPMLIDDNEIFILQSIREVTRYLNRLLAKTIKETIHLIGSKNC